MKTITHIQLFRTEVRRSHSLRGGLAAFVSALALGCWPLLGAADCVDTRKAAVGESEFHSRAMAALVAALPPAPSGGKLQNKDSVTSLGQLCQGKTGDFSLEATRFYQLNDRYSIVSVAMNVRRLPAADNALSAAYGTASPNRSEGMKVNNVVWSVSGSDTPLRQALADAMDRTHLQALVGRPLPSEAQSAAYAAKAVPVNVAKAVPANVAIAPAAPEPVGEPLKKAADTVNLLRVLIGR